MATTSTYVTVRDGLQLPLHTSGSARPLLIVPGIANDPLLTWEPSANISNLMSPSQPCIGGEPWAIRPPR